MGGTATQSSQYHADSADKAIDGNRDNQWNHHSCSVTQYESSPWWRLNLLKPYKINNVTITFHEDIYYIGAEIRIGNCLDENGNNNPR